MKPWQRLRNAFLRQLAGAGWAGVLGIALGMFAVAFAFSGNTERKTQLNNIASQRTELAAQLARELRAEPSPREILDRFHKGFPEASALPDILLQLDASARKQGLSPRRAEYGESGEGSGSFRRIRINMPITGSYTALRGWLAQAQNEIPALNIEGLDLQRANAAQPELEAQVRLVVYLREAS